MENNIIKSDRILRLPEVIRRVGLKRSSIYNRMKDGTFPKSSSLGGNSVGWLESDIIAWMQKQFSKGYNF
jgi:prophage regulatory protein